MCTSVSSEENRFTEIFAQIFIHPAETHVLAYIFSFLKNGINFNQLYIVFFIVDK